ncbi:MAG: conserved membrane protein of unknown function [Candidatus Thorarchaeota archaeon]|nr:MAG: conserved membrane protein of unknown function [Candidatus Thorarchaeota archaeon]
MSKVATFFGLKQANEDILQLAGRLAILLPIVSATIQLSTTFFMIFVAEALGGGSYIEGLALVGVLVVIQMGIQTILDYPTGALGDYIGQRYVITGAFLSFALGFYLVSFVNTSTPFLYLVLIYALMGLGNSQMSGSFNAWFDNNYRAAMPGDTERKQYGVFWGKVGMLFQVVATASLIPGGILAVVLGRSWVFQLQAILCVVIAIVVMFVVQDFPEVAAMRTERPSMSEYKNLLGSGVRFLFSSKFVKHLVIGGCVLMSATMVWGNLILFPMYFSYLLTDVAVSSFRTVLFLPGVVTSERSGVWAKRFEPQKWIPRFRALQSGGFIFYLSFAFIMLAFPPADTGVMMQVMIPFTQIIFLELPASNVLPILFMTATFVFTGLFGGIAEILTQRELLDVIPNEIRNSMYSLAPTIGTIIAIPQIALFGWLISVVGFPFTLMIVSIVSLCGMMLVRDGLRHPKPVLEDKSETSLISKEVAAD